MKKFGSANEDGYWQGMEGKMHAAVLPILPMTKIEIKILVKNVLIDGTQKI